MESLRKFYHIKVIESLDHHSGHLGPPDTGNGMEEVSNRQESDTLL